MKVAVVGYGIEGQENYRYWTARGDEVTIVDERDELSDVPLGVPVITGSQALRQLDGFDLVVRTAGLAPTKLQTSAKVWSATNEFFRQCPAPIIGVTGSKGKGTTCSLIVSILRAAGYTVHLLGNIGQPALAALPEITPDDVVVYELSSFQLWDLERSPHQAAVLHIEPDHLDVHADMAEYLAAKANIVKYQTRTDTVVYHPTNQWSLTIARQQPQFDSRAAKYATPDNGNKQMETAYVEADKFVTTRGRTLSSTSALKLPGAHNLDNACAAMSICLNYSVEPAQFAAGLAAFTGLPHRLKHVSELGGVRYYDDSIATTPGSAIAAARAFAEPKVMILGGSSKGADFDELAAALMQTNVRQVLLIGQEAPRIAAALDARGLHDYEHVSGGMTQIVARAAEVSQPGDVVVLSPACASFDMFRSYQDRGDQFIAAVEARAAILETNEEK